jgi:Homeodomain-like domain
VRMARGFPGGEPIEVTKPMESRRRRLTDDELARVRARWMKRMKDSGSPPAEIGAIFRCTPRHVRREIKALESQYGGLERTA